MIPWEFLESAQVPGNGGELCLYRRGAEFSIRVGNRELMNSRVHASEEALAELACARVADRPRPRVLIGGLGMGFTLAATLHRLGPEGRVVLAELVPAVVAWNRGPLAALAGHPLQDARVIVREGDVAKILRETSQAYDAILLDVDNGPEGLARRENDWLYARPGLEAAHAALRPAGVLAVWSAAPNQVFVQRLRRTGFTVDEIHVPARSSRKGRRHTIWLAARAS
jgi:spermidine synthase